MKKIYRNSNVNSLKIEKVIIVKSIVGEGTHEDVCREITEIFDLNGKLITRIDNYRNELDLSTIREESEE
jgi:hypothetical protein